jgi:hypothetical protein
LPAYGRELLDIRRRGLVPHPRLVIVNVGWNASKAHGPHILGYGVVVPDEDDPEGLDFCGVAGLPVLVVARYETPVERVHAIVNQVLKFAPLSVRVWRLISGETPETHVVLRESTR